MITPVSYTHLQLARQCPQQRFLAARADDRRYAAGYAQPFIQLHYISSRHSIAPIIAQFTEKVQNGLTFRRASSIIITLSLIHI